MVSELAECGRIEASMTNHSLRWHVGKAAVIAAIVGLSMTAGGLLLGSSVIAVLGCLVLIAGAYAAVYARVGSF
jgi:hypothetical protein